MANIYLRECSTTEPGQVWNVFADGRIAVDASPKPRRSFFVLSLPPVFTLPFCNMGN